MTWGSVIQYGALRRKQKEAKDLKEFLEIEDRINIIFPRSKKKKQ